MLAKETSLGKRRSARLSSKRHIRDPESVAIDYLACAAYSS
jgi:hypothetical protein